MVLLHYMGLESDTFAVVFGVSLSLLLGHLSYTIIENPVRNGLASYKNSSQLAIALLLVATSSVIFSYAQGNYINGRIDPAIEKLSSASQNYRKDRDACQPNINGLHSPGCIFGDENANTLAYLIGDSHADMVATAVGESVENGNVKFYGRMGCPTITDVLINKSSRVACLNFNHWLFDFLEKDTTETPVILVNSIWIDDSSARISFEGMENDIESLKLKFKEKVVEDLCKIAKKRDVYVVLPIPNADSVAPDIVTRKLILGDFKIEELSKITTPTGQQLKRAKFVRETYESAQNKCGVHLLDPIPYFCDEKECTVVQNGEHFYYDANHLNEFGNKRLVPMFNTIFD